MYTVMNISDNAKIPEKFKEFFVEIGAKLKFKQQI